MTTEQQVRDIIEREIGIDENEVTSKARLCDDLHMDSLDRIEFFVKVEEVFGITINDDDMDGLETVHQVIAYVERQRKS